MKSRNCNCKILVLLLIITFLPGSCWMNPDFLTKSSDAVVSYLTKLNNRDESNITPGIIFHTSTLQMGPISHTPEQQENISPSCHKVVAKLANASASLISCFIQNARPVTVCQSCVDKYINFHDVYRNICIPTDNNETQQCEDQLLNKDRLNVIKTICNFGSSLWNQGFCSNCFTKKGKSVVESLNNDTEKFLRKYSSVKSCFQQFPLPQTYRNGSACSSCFKVYFALAKDYEHLQQEYPKAVCMDLTDIMNSTRKLWSDYYKCKLIPASGTYIYLMTALFCVLVVLFYSGYRFIAHAQNTRIIGQKRFVHKHSYNSSSSGQHQLNSLH